MKKLTALLLALLSYAVIFLLADPIADLFNKDQNTALTSIAADGMRIYFTSLCLTIPLTVTSTSPDQDRCNFLDDPFILHLLQFFLSVPQESTINFDIVLSDKRGCHFSISRCFRHFEY